MRHALLLTLIFLAAASPAASQSRAMRIDFGSDSATTGSSSGQSWNDVDSGNSTQPLALVDISGVATGASFAFSAGLELVNANSTGTTSPALGSALASLGWPTSALRDSLWASGNSQPFSEFTLTGLEPTATYDVTIVASRMGVADQRATRYTSYGARTVTAVIEPANNDSEFVRLAGLAADAAGTLRVELSPFTTNTNSSAWYYVNAIAIDEFAQGIQAPLVGLSTNQLHVERPENAAPFVQSVDLYTNNGTAPSVALSLVDPTTLAAPTWASIAPSGTPGSPVAVTFDPAGVSLGRNTAILTAQAGGYLSAVANLTFDVRPPGGLNVLFYGNSFSQGHGGVPSWVAQIAVEAGHVEPNDVARLVGGRDLAFHLNDPTQAAAITTALAPGEEWDYVVLQGLSLEATATLGDPATFRANAVAIVANVRAHSPNARAVLFQTWARGSGHSVYTPGSGAFESPYEMHREIEENYTLAVADINAAFGPGTASRAAVGETAALVGFDQSWYASDIYHAAASLSLAAAATIYSAIYEQTLCSVTPDFNGNGALVNRLATYGLGEGDWVEVVGLADRVASRDIRHLPGSGEDLLLRTSGAAGVALTACPIKATGPGELLSHSITSPAATYGQVPGLLYFELAPTGSLPGATAAFPEFHLTLNGARPLHFAPQIGTGTSLTFTISSPLVGTSLLVQGLALAPSAKTGNPRFTATDAHELRLQ